MANADGYLQALIETTPNGELNPSALSATPFYQRLVEFDWAPNPVYMDRSDELDGFADNIPPDLIEFGEASCTAKARLHPNLIGIYLFALYGAPVSTAGNGVITDPSGATIPAGATRHVWQAGTNTGAVRSFQAQLGYTDESMYFKLRGLVCDQFDISDNGAESEMSASLKALYYTQQANPSLTPAYDATSLKPFGRAMHTRVTWLANSGIVNAIKYSVANPLTIAKTLAGSRWPDKVDRTGRDLVLTAELDMRDLDVDDWNAFTGNTQFTVLTQYLHTQFITGSYPYGLFIQGNGVYTGLTPEGLQHKMRHGATIPVTFGRAAGGTESHKLTLVNSVASYSSVG